MTRYEILTKLTHDIDPELVLIFNDVDDAYYAYELGAISIDPYSTYDAGFLEHLREVHKCEYTDDFPLVLWSLLHEIGHHFTLDDIDTDEDLQARVLCSMVSNEVADRVTDVRNLYYNLPSEWVATEWAIDYIADNWELCTEIAKELA